MKDIVFCTHVSDHLYNTIGANKFVKSARFFHPEIDLVVFDNKILIPLMQNDNRINWNNIHPIVSRTLANQYKTVIHFDADSMLTGKLTELLDAIKQYDVVGVRNNNDFQKAGKDSPISCHGVPYNKYLNAGLVAVSNPGFYEDWIKLNFEKSDFLPFGENDVLNMLIYNSDIYSSFIIDDIDSKVHYGVSGLYGNNTHWDSWKDITIDNNNLILNNKIVKVLHHAGGFNSNKLNFDMFSNEVKTRLTEIYECNN